MDIRKHFLTRRGSDGIHCLVNLLSLSLEDFRKEADSHTYLPVWVRKSQSYLRARFMNKITPDLQAFQAFFPFNYLGSYSFLQNHQQVRFLPGRSNADTKEIITTPKDLHPKKTHH